MITAALMLTLLAACGGPSGFTAKDAEQVALEHAGLSAEEVSDIHTHSGSYGDLSVFEIHITVGTEKYEYLVEAGTGKILYADEMS